MAEFSLYQLPETYRLLAARRPYGYLVACAETLAEQLSEELDERVQPTDVLIDAPPPDREIEFNVEIFFPKEGVYRPLHTVSPVVERLPAPSSTITSNACGSSPTPPGTADQRLGCLLALPGDGHFRDQ